jgi:hypothetical protein
MSKLDELIRDALEGEGREAFEETEELGWFALSLSQFRGKLGWVTWVLMIVQSTMFIVGAWCAVRFFQETELLTALKWGLSGAVLWITATNLKLSLMPQMQADRVIRQLRRVELLLASQNGEK